MSLNNIEENIGANVSIFECVCSGSNPQMSPFFSFFMLQMFPFFSVSWCKCLHLLVSSGANVNVSIFWLVVVQISPFFC